MKPCMLALAAVATLPVLACGAAPPGTTEAGVPAEEVRTTQEAASARPTPNQIVPRQRFTTIDFDTDPSGYAVAMGTDVATLYASKGVTFSCELAPGNNNDRLSRCAAGDGPFAGYGGRAGNSVSVWDPQWEEYFFTASSAVVVATFPRNRSFVSIDVYSHVPGEDWDEPPAGTIWLEAYDWNGTLIARDDEDPAPEWKTLTVSSRTTNIAYVRFSSGYIGAYDPAWGMFDNLVFDNPPITVPQPIIPIQPLP